MSRYTSSAKAKIIREKDEDPLKSDLSSLLLEPGWQKVKFEFGKKDKTITLRVSDAFLKEVQKKAKKSGMSYQKWIRMIIEQVL